MARNGHSLKAKNGPVLIAVACAGAVLTLLSHAARADQGGVPFWLSGQFASLAAVPATPGWSLITMPYYYHGSANASKDFQIGETVAAGVKS